MKTRRYPPINPKCNEMLHGGDYNPEQWKDYKGVWEEDMRLMKLSGCNAMSVGIFSWVNYEAKEGTFDFSWLDKIMDMLAENNAYAVLATPSGAKPTWMSAKYPQIRRVTQDGHRDPHKARHNHCYTSPIYRKKVSIINRKLAQRYKDHPALLVWHISNEYNGECYCGLCWKAFRAWLKKRYRTLDHLNHAWWTNFWSHKYTKWEQIDALDYSVHGLMLDWKRFVTHQTLDFMRHEIKPLKELTPDVPVTTNFMGVFPGLDYWQMAPYLDVISWDSYPHWRGDESDRDLVLWVSFMHDLNRSFKGGKPFMLMESTPSATNWQQIGRPKRPGMHLLSSLLAVAHGSDTVQYFQWRKSRGSAEKFHGAVVDHEGTERTREFKGVAEVGAALKKLKPVVGCSVEPEVAVIHDWDNRWAFDASAGPRNVDKDYGVRCIAHYRYFWTKGIPVDVIDMDQDISRYKLIAAPMLYMLKPGVATRLENFVKRGGTLVTTYRSGIVNESDLCFLGGFPGPLRKMLGIWAEETDVFYDHQEQSVVMKNGNPLGMKGKYKAMHYADIIHLEGARALATYGNDFYKGEPAVTVNRFGAGEAYYLASRNEDKFLLDFYAGLEKKLKLERALKPDLPEGVTAQVRGDGKKEYVFLLNFNPAAKVVRLGPGAYTDLLGGKKHRNSIRLPGFGATVLARA